VIRSISSFALTQAWPKRRSPSSSPSACSVSTRRPPYPARRGTAHLVALNVVDALEVLAHADRPRERHGGDAQMLFDFVEQFERLAHFAVELVDEGDDRRLAAAADFEQLQRLRFDAVRAVDHHHGGVDRGQHAVGVFGEVFVARGVEQVDDGSRRTRTA
jgi:hypothetical protein